MIAFWLLNTEHLEIFEKRCAEVGYYHLHCYVYRSGGGSVLLRYFSLGITVQLHLQHFAVFFVLDHTQYVNVNRSVVSPSVPILQSTHPCSVSHVVHSVHLRPKHPCTDEIGRHCPFVARQSKECILHGVLRLVNSYVAEP